MIEGITESIVFHLKASAYGGEGLKDIGYARTPAKNGVRIQHGAFTIALVTEDRAEDVEAMSRTLIDESVQWQDYDDLCKLMQDFVRLQQHLREELTGIILRRVVPGKCTYCPF